MHKVETQEGGGARLYPTFLAKVGHSLGLAGKKNQLSRAKEDLVPFCQLATLVTGEPLLINMEF